MKKLDISELSVRPFHLLDKEWALLVGGNKDPNPMTVSWGGMGTLWNRPVATVYVRPTRHTFSLLNEHPEFTLNFMDESVRPALNLCGTKSGRDLNKWEAAGLSMEAPEKVSVPCVAGARLSLECRILATLDVDPGRFLDASIDNLYAAKDYHRVFFGEVLCARKN